MEIQTLTFDVRGMTERQAYFFVESFRLGISEFDGLISHARARRSVAGEYVVFCTWKNERAVTEFRRSETYARFALSPNVVDLADDLEAVFKASVTEDMIALAA